MNKPGNPLVTAIELQNQGKTAEAERIFRQILDENPNDAAAIYSLSVILLQRGGNLEAKEWLDRGVLLSPSFAPLWFAHGSALQGLGLKNEALQSYDKALELKPDYREVLINSGALLRDLHRHHEALQRFNQVLTFDPDNAAALGNCGIMLTELKQSELAIPMFERLLGVMPDYDYGKGLLAYERLHACDWSHFSEDSEKIVSGVRDGKRVCKTLAFMSFSDSADEHHQCAKIFGNHLFSRTGAPLWNGERYRHDRIRLAYVSPDLREHPVGHLMAGILERHDKTRFETIAISLGIDDKSRLRERMVGAFDRFLDVGSMGAPQIARLMRDLEIDIAVDLAGYTSDSRTDVFAHRPAPVQANYLGYAGTLGVDYMDYIIADRHVIPPEHQRFYSEKVVYLPDAYLPTDSSLMISDRTPSRAECGLPDNGVVYCSFSNDYKISPSMFDLWMRLLLKTPGSVLWLMSRSEVSQRNLRKEAAARGVDPVRLIFAGRVPRIEDHLARYRVADMFLDTHPYNAHSTAADALMAGLPVITCMGQAFPARVAGSLLHAIGLPELIATTFTEYEDLALGLAHDPQRLSGLKARLIKNRDSWPLFNTDLFCRNIEALYIAMWRQTQLGGAKDELS